MHRPAAPESPVASDSAGSLSSASVEPPGPGTRLGKYRLLSLIGRGGMGVVHEALDPVLTRRVAIKTPRTDACVAQDVEALRLRFLAEARLASRLDHPHLVAVHDYGESAGRPFIVMERVRGRPLSSHLVPGRPQPLAEVAAWALPLLEALHAVHRAGIVHRDVKPANVFLVEGGGLKLGDFGVARAWEPDAPGAAIDRTCRVSARPAGTPCYAAPEQWRPGVVTPAADLFAVGVMLRQALTGRRPVPVPAGRDVPSMSGWRTDLPASLGALLHRALQPSPSCRPPDAAAFAHALRLALAESGVPLPPAGEIHSAGRPATPRWRQQAVRDLHRAGEAFAEADAALDEAQCLVADRRLLVDGEAAAANAQARAQALQRLAQDLADGAAQARGLDPAACRRLQDASQAAAAHETAQRTMAARLRALHGSWVAQLDRRLHALEERLALLEVYGDRDARALADASRRSPWPVPVDALARRLAVLRGAHRQCVASLRALEAAGRLPPSLHARCEAARGRLVIQAERLRAQGEALGRWPACASPGRAAPGATIPP